MNDLDRLVILAASLLGDKHTSFYDVADLAEDMLKELKEKAEGLKNELPQ
jgi:hypothetical protein